MNKLELATYLQERVSYITTDNKFTGVIIGAREWYVLLNELGVTMIGETNPTAQSSDAEGTQGVS